jgi:hypothetical protein
MDDWLQRIKQLLGFFNLTDFEKALIDKLRDGLSSDLAEILDDQLSRFNQVDRAIKFGPATSFGHTSFYWGRFGKSVLDFHETFSGFKKEDTLATMEVVSLGE